METQSEITGNGIPPSANGGGTVDLSGVVKRGRGRPPGSKNGSGNAKATPPASEPLSETDAVYLADTVVLLLESADEIIAKTLTNRLTKVAPERAADFAALRQQVGLNDKDRNMARQCVKALVKKYAILGRFGPELLMLVFLGQYSYRQLKLGSFVADLELEHKKAAGARPVNGSQARVEFPGPVNSGGN